MEIKKYTNKILIFAINSFLVFVIVLIIKNKDENKFYFENKTDVEIIPVSPYILSLQGAIATYRESRLRDLNTAPKSIKQKNITTTTTTISTPKSDRKTKTS